MADEDSQTRQFWLMVFLAIWVGAFGYSFTFLMIEPTGSGFTRGMNRTAGFFGWQGIAAMLAFALWAIGRSFPKRSGVRRISAVPLGMTLALILILLGYIGYHMSLT